MTRSIPAAVLLAAAFAVAAQAQNTPVQAPPQMLTVDFTAFGPDGLPVLNLQPDEITIRVGSRERPLRGLELVPIGGLAGLEDVPEPFASSIQGRPRNRTILIVFDEESVRPGREGAFRPAIAQLLGSLAASDRVALATVPLGGIRVNFTTDHATVRQTFNGLSGRAPRSETSSELACRTRRTLESLTGMLDGITAGDGPLSVIFISSSLSAPTRDTTTRTAFDPRIGPGMCELVPDKFEDLVNAAAAARVNFIVVQPEDQMIAPGALSPSDIAGSRVTDSVAGLEYLSGITGSELLRLTGDGSDTVERVLRHSSSYYAATIDADPGDRGSVARLDVRTSRPDVTVRARPRVALVKPNPDAGRKSSVTPADMLRQARAYGEFPLRAIGYVSSNPDDETQLRVIAVAEAAPTAPLAGAAIGLYDPDGKLVAQWTARPEEIAEQTIMAAMLAPPGRYRMRVAATDTAGRAAAADYDLDATLQTAGPIRMSGLILGVSREGGFFPRMIFSTEPSAIAQVELLDVPPGERPTGRIEIARSLDGPAIASLPAAITPSPDPSRAVLSGVMPVGALPAGDYVIRVVVTAPDGSTGRVVRTLRKVT